MSKSPDILVGPNTLITQKVITNKANGGLQMTDFLLVQKVIAPKRQFGFQTPSITNNQLCEIVVTSIGHMDGNGSIVPHNDFSSRETIPAHLTNSRTNLVVIPSVVTLESSNGNGTSRLGKVITRRIEETELPAELQKRYRELSTPQD